MSTFDWKATQFEERWFHALVCLLARTNHQQDAYDTGHLDEAESDHGDDDRTDIENETETISPRKIASRFGKKTLKEKFLDRLAEVMAREVTRAKKGDDVFATGTLDSENFTVVYVARNGGLADSHKEIMKKIQVWLRAVASTGERRDILKDNMWSELVLWSLPRLEYYRDQLGSSFNAWQGARLENPLTLIGSKLVALQDYCTSQDTSNPERSILPWTEIITLCFELRYESTLLSQLEVSLDTTNAKMVWRSIAFMGRLRSAYETFIEFAMQFATTRSVKLLGLDTPVPLTLQAFDKAELSGKLTSAGIDLNRLTFREKKKIVKTKSRKLEILKGDFEKQVRVHAEIQILIELVDKKNDKKVSLKEFDYIGCSKKCCYLCWCLLRGFYRVRGCHGKIYPRWNVSTSSLLKSWASLKLHSRLSEMGSAMLEQLRSPTRSKLPYVAESTASITTASTTKVSHRYRRLLDEQRAKSQRKASLTTQKSVFGRELKKIHVLRIPGDGGIPRLVKVPIRATSEAYHSNDHIALDVPDFGEFWEGQLNFDRNFHPLEIIEQEDIDVGCEAMNGQYRVYFNLSEEHPPNEYLKKLVIDGTIPNERKFWNGDTFVVKLATRFIEPTRLMEPTPAVTRRIKKKIEVESDDNGHTMYQDVPECILRSTMLARLFRKLWQERMLERLLEMDQESEQFATNIQNNKDIILARMTETEKKVLDLLPPNFIELLAIEFGDHGASRNYRVSEDPNNPEMYLVSFERKIDALEMMDWAGFSSGHL